jgi:hypothetical protein
MTTKKIKKYPCLGGPMCGREVEKPASTDRFYCYDDERQKHYYRLVCVTRENETQEAVFYHYFGTSKYRADKFLPSLFPPDALFKARRKKR